MKTLELVLDEKRKEVDVMARNGGQYAPEAVRQLLSEVASAAEDYLLWLSESEAMIRTGRSRRWLRGQFPAWLDQGHARIVNGDRQYRALVLPRRANPSAAYEAGKRAALGAA